MGYKKETTEKSNHGNEEKPKMVFLPEKPTLRAIDIKPGMHIRLHSGGNMGELPTGHTSFFPYIRLKMPKMVFHKNT